MDLPRYLRAPEVANRLGISKSTLWKWTDEGRFPKPALVGPNVRAWRDDVVAAWMRKRPIKEAEAA
jgi:prophage regulatory protein